jgi:hypothetical protein
MCTGSQFVVQLLAAYESPDSYYIIQEWYQIVNFFIIIIYG